jgi:hypothetical protein
MGVGAERASDSEESQRRGWEEGDWSEYIICIYNDSMIIHIKSCKTENAEEEG